MKRIAAILLLITGIPALAQKQKLLSSPDASIQVKITTGNELTYQVFYQNEPLTGICRIDMTLTDGRSLAPSKGVKRISTRTVRDLIVSPVPEKRKNIPDVYNELTIFFRSSFAVVFRAYNDGVAYRIGSTFKDSVHIAGETAEFSFTTAHPFIYSQVQGGRPQDIFHTSFEEVYYHKTIDSVKNTDLIFNPALVLPEKGPRIAITESDVEDYPGMFLSGSGQHKLTGRFAPYPKRETTAPGEYSQVVVAEREDFIAHSTGSRWYPWRVLMVAKEDKDLPANDLVYRLASPSRVKDVSWIKPAQSTDEWIIAENLFNVDFKTGINTATYKYYIDFAKRFGIESVMMDAGWSDNNDLFKITPGLDIEEIMRYARQQGVRINMWTLAITLDKQLEPALERFNKWGVNFIMTDFFDRDDQKTSSLIKRIAEACARHKIMIMFHGASKPSGFNRTYPHAITREGVLGSEYNMWSAKATPSHNVTLPFTRMLAGPMDYEPGLLENGTRKTFRPIEENVMSYGTRTNQLAMYVVYESPIQFFSGNPSQGMLEPQFMELLGSIPTVWDTTVMVDAKVAQYIVTARKSGSDWYLGAMTDSVARTIAIPLSFLGEGEYIATICQDGINADRYAADYRIVGKTVAAQDLLSIPMQPGGGIMARFRRK